MQPVTNPLVAGHLPAIQPTKPAEPAPPTVVAPSSVVASIPENGPNSAQAVEKAAKLVEKFVQPISSDLQFSVDEASGTPVVRVIDRNTRELIRQIPSEEMLAIAQALDRLQGLLVRQKA